jgi:hypothetical protein
VSCVLSGKGLCFGLIARPEESYRVLSWRVDTEGTLAQWGCCAMEKKNVKLTNFQWCPHGNFSLAVF